MADDEHQSLLERGRLVGQQFFDYRPNAGGSPTYATYLDDVRRQVRRFLTSKYGHYSVLLLVSLDVGCIFADFLISLYICEHSCGTGQNVSKGLPKAQEGLGIVSLVFSCLFMIELLASIWAFRFQ